MEQITDIRWKQTSFGWKLQVKRGDRLWEDVKAVDESGGRLDDPKIPVVTKVISF